MIDIFVADVLNGMTHSLNNEQLAELKQCMIINFRNKQLISTSTEVATVGYDELNNKFIERYRISLQVKGLSQNTIYQYLRAIKIFLDNIGKRFTDINKNDVECFFYCSNSNISINTLDNSFKFTKQFFAWATKSDYIPCNPFDKVDFKRPKPVKKEVLTEIEKTKIRDACANMDELALIDFLLATGVRVGELINLKKTDVNFMSGIVTVYAHKTNTYRDIPMDAKCMLHLQEYLKKCNTAKNQSIYLFPNRKGGQWNTNGVERMVKNIASRTDLNMKVTVHTFRKTLATTLSAKGCRPDTIAYILGHKDFSTTSKYYILYSTNEIKNEYLKCV